MDEQNTEMVRGAMPSKVAGALVKAQAHATGVEKGAYDKHLGRNYASMDQIIQEARASLAHAGLGVLVDSWRTHDSVLEVAFLVVHESGETWRSGPVEVPVVVKGGMAPDKATATALTYATGYFERALCNLPRVEKGAQPDERDDRDYRPQQAQKPAQQQKAQPTMCHPDGPHAQQQGAIMALADLEGEHLDEYHAWVTQRVLDSSGPTKQKVFAHLRKVQAEYQRRGRDLPKDEAAE